MGSWTRLRLDPLPFFAGKTGFARSLSKAQWIALGQSLKAIHTTPVPAALAEALPQERYSPRWRGSVKALQQQMENFYQGYDQTEIDLVALSYDSPELGSYNDLCYNTNVETVLERLGWQ